VKIIGKLIKKTAALGYKRIHKKRINAHHQTTVLWDLMSTAKNTQFGVYHRFSEKLKRKELVRQFQEEVPIQDYEAFHTAWLSGTIDGLTDRTWPGKIKYFALSSGTTGSPSKRIPVSIEMIRSFQKSSVRQYASMHILDLDEYFFSASGLAVGGSSKLKKVGTRYEGDLSGILKKHTSILVKPITKPNNKIAGISDWNDKLNAMVDQAPKWNIGIIAGIPSWCVMLMERIVQRYALNSIHDIWPNLRVYAHGGVYMDPYVDRLKKISSKEIFLLDTYLASEGYFAFQVNPEELGMKLLLNSGIFFEFIPFDSHYFNEEGELIDDKKALSIDDVKEGVDYALVITTNAGLWRYLIGDLVRFVDVRDHRIIISGRIKQFLSLCGEHLSLDNINQGLKLLNDTSPKVGAEFTIVVDKVNSRHHWFFEVFDNKINVDQVIHELDVHLCRLNDDYASARKYNLNQPIATLVPEGTFYRFMETFAKFGSQTKMPRVLNDKQSSDWLSYLKQD